MAKKKGTLQIQPISPKNYIIKFGRNLEIGGCWQLTLPENGLMQFVVSRIKKNGKLIVGFYLIDLYCLGLKDTFFIEYDDFDEFQDEILSKPDYPMVYEEIDSNLCFNYIYGNIEYAEDLGLKPHKDFKVTEFLLEDVEEIEYEDIEFGLNGKPTFIPGPDDNVKRILAILDENIGKGNYDFLNSFDEEIDEDEDDDDENINTRLEKYELEVEHYNRLTLTAIQEIFQAKIDCFEQEIQTELAMILTFAIYLENSYEYDFLFENYSTTPNEIVDKAAKLYLTKLEVNGESDFDIFFDTFRRFFTLVFEHYLYFESPYFICVEDIIQTFAASMSENYEMDFWKVNLFLSTFENKINLSLICITDLLSEEFYDRIYSELNASEKDKILDETFKVINDFKKENLADERVFLVDYLIDFVIFSDFVPKRNENELRKGFKSYLNELRLESTRNEPI